MKRTHVYTFGGGEADGGATMKELLGGKGANLAEMARLGVPVPPGFTITTDVCTWYTSHGATYPSTLHADVESAIAKLDAQTGKCFGSVDAPLLLSVRSGARVSMPGMMDTVLNLGLNDVTVEGLARLTGNPRFAWDCYRRFIAMYGDVVMGLKPTSKREEDPFERVLSARKQAAGVGIDSELTADHLRALVAEYKSVIRKRTGEDFPQDPRAQLWGAITAVFASWENSRAKAYRQMYNIPDDWGTAVNVQTMVFGNTGPASGTGVAFTRDPATGERTQYGEFLLNAQGEDVVAGTRTPLPISALADAKPEIHAELVAIMDKLERHYSDMQDVEFTIEEGKLWLLQTRTGKRTGAAAVRMAVEMVQERLITAHEAVMRPDPAQLTQLLAPIFDLRAKAVALKEDRLLAKGLAAGPGAASGRIVFNAPDAEAWGRRGEDVILVRIETSPEDIRGMKAALGILTAQGGMTSHAALVARQMGKACVAGCGVLHIDYEAGQMRVGDRVLKEGDYISLDGSTGEVLLGRLETFPSEIVQVLVDRTLKPEDSLQYQQFAKLLSWADSIRTMGVRCNADQPDQASEAVAFGAEGIGLCRTEHMFFGEGRIKHVREMILAESDDDRNVALSKLEPMQRGDFLGLFKVMDAKHVTIRLLDPPLHEFLPHTDADIADVAAELGVSPESVTDHVAQLREVNPMLGHRGCRLAVTWPAIYEMQVRAIIDAACDASEAGAKVAVGIMIPLTNHGKELRHIERIARSVAEETLEARGMRVDYQIGTMIELPRACLVANRLALTAEFFSFGTNDLTQTTFGISRDDAGHFMSDYLDHHIYDADPFVSIDEHGVGELMRIARDKGRATNPYLELGICGEQGGDPRSIDLCRRLGFNYVSCSPYRVPVARLAAAQAEVNFRSAARSS